MVLLKLQLKHYWQGSLTRRATLLFVLLFCGVLVRYHVALARWPVRRTEAYGLNQFTEITGLHLLAFVFFTFIAFEFLYSLRACDTYETVAATANGRNSYYWFGILVLLIHAFVFTVLIMAYTLMYASHLGLVRGELVRHLFFSIILNYGLVLIVGVLVGALTSFVAKKNTGYLLLIVYLLFYLPVMERVVSQTIAVGFFGFVSSALRPVAEALRFGPQETTGTALNNAFGFSLLPFRWHLSVAWISGLLALFILVLYKLRGHWVRLLAALLAGVTVWNLFAYHARCEVLPENFGDLYGSTQSQDSFEPEAEREAAANFSLNELKLELSLGNITEGVSQYFMDKITAPQVNFTLHRNFAVREVYDADTKQRFAYTREGDYLTVDLGSAYNPSLKLVISYAGIAQSMSDYYATAQAAYLPGGLAYLPLPGFHMLLIEEEGTLRERYNPIAFSKPIPITCTVQAKQEFHCNLPRLQRNHFAGVATSLTLVSGFYEDKEIAGRRIVYPYLYTTEQAIRQLLEKFGEIEMIPAAVKTIFIVEGVPVNWATALAAELDDYWIMSALNQLIEPYITKVISEENGDKRFLLRDLFEYEFDPDYWLASREMVVADLKPNALEWWLEPIYRYISAGHKVDRAGMLERAYRYCYDNSDRRGLEDFIADELRANGTK